MSEKNCGFQYAKMSGTIFKNTNIVVDKVGLTLEEAKGLWADHYSDCAKHIHQGGTVEMVIWINMPDSHSYGEHLDYISTDAESDGRTIWETKKYYFPSYLKLNK